MKTFDDKLNKEIEHAMKFKRKFIGVYSSHPTSLSGDSIEEAVKDFYNHYNANLNMLMNLETGAVYKAKENDEPDCRGNFNHSFYDKCGDMVFNEDILTKPLIPVKPTLVTKNNKSELEHGYIDREGKFFKCGFECHQYLAAEIFITNTTTFGKDQNNEYQAKKYLDELGWVKISSKGFHWGYNENTHQHIKLSNIQKRVLIRLMEILGDEQYEINSMLRSKNEIEIMLNEI